MMIGRQTIKARLAMCVLGAVVGACQSAAPTGNPATLATTSASTIPGTSRGPTASPSPNPLEAALAGYLAVSSSATTFLQWTRTDGAVEGTMTHAYWGNGTSAQLQHQSAPFTGVISGNSVTLKFPAGLGFQSSWTGAFQGDSLVMSYGAADGSLATLAFRPATVADYNSAVSHLQARGNPGTGVVLFGLAAGQDLCSVGNPVTTVTQGTPLYFTAILRDHMTGNDSVTLTVTKDGEPYGTLDEPADGTAFDCLAGDPKVLGTLDRGEYAFEVQHVGTSEASGTLVVH